MIKKNTYMKAAHYDYFSSLSFLMKIKYIFCKEYLRDIELYCTEKKIKMRLK